jgi:hypothetical protein
MLMSGMELAFKFSLITTTLGEQVAVGLVQGHEEVGRVFMLCRATFKVRCVIF